MSNGIVSFNLGHAKVECRFYDQGENRCVDYKVKDSMGDTLAHGCLCVHVPTIAKHVVVSMGADPKVGLSWKGMKKRVARYTHKATLRKLVRDVKKIAEDPRIQKSAMFAATIYPPLGVTYGTILAASKIADKVANGDPDAIEQVKKLNAMRKAGDPRATAEIKAIFVADRAKKAGYNVGAWVDNIRRGWLANVPYRTSLGARELDPKNPKHIARHMYNDHLRHVAMGKK